MRYIEREGACLRAGGGILRGLSLDRRSAGEQYQGAGLRGVGNRRGSRSVLLDGTCPARGVSNDQPSSSFCSHFRVSTNCRM